MICQLYMCEFKDGDMICIEFWCVKVFFVVVDLMVNWIFFDNIICLGGFILVGMGVVFEVNFILVLKDDVDSVFDVVICIGCGVCVVQCFNGVVQFFIVVKVVYFGFLLQGQVQCDKCVVGMVEMVQQEEFGFCMNYCECEVVCLKFIFIWWIVCMNWDYFKVKLCGVEV